MIDTSYLRPHFPAGFGRVCKIAAVLMAGLPVSTGFAANFVWNNISGSFTDPNRWVGGVAPLGTDPTDVLTFGGDVTTPYFATSDSTTNPFLINQLVFNATGATGVQTIDGTTTIKLGGTNPMIIQNGVGAITIKAPIQLGANLTISGADSPTPDANRITMDGTMSGNFNITKDGTFSFRFGSATGTSYSQNTWYGGLTINGGIIRFNNNAYAAPTALRGNPVTLTSASSRLSTQFGSTDPDSSLRMGTLNGPAGSVDGRRATPVIGQFDSIDIVVNTLEPGTFGGTVNNTFALNGDNDGRLIVRGAATQTFTGTLILANDIVVGNSAGVTLAGNTSLATQTTNATVVLNGGVFTLDNSVTNVTEPTNSGGRLRDGAIGQNGLEPVGGGKFSLIGNAAGTSETIAELQLGSASAANARSGALTINVTSNGASGSLLTMQSYARNIAAAPYNTVNFTANDGAAPLGVSATGSRIKFGTSFTVPLFANLMGNTGAGASAANVGWATVNGIHFASYNTTNGVTPVAITATNPDGSTGGSTSGNYAVTGNLSLTNASGFAASSIEIVPTADGQAIDIATVGNLKAPGILLAGPIDYSITSSGGGGVANAVSTNPRYFHIQSATLNISANMAAANATIVKSGAGLLNLTNAGNVGVTQPLVINEGAVRATQGSSLPAGELRFRGGVLELSGGTFSRTIGGSTSATAVNTVNWTGMELGLPIGQEKGSGGFAAVGADATVDLTSVFGNSEFAWEDTGFVNSGHALIFGSPRATAKVTWVDNLSLTASGQVTNYNAREIKVLDNPSSQLDAFVMSGKISGVVNDDLLKTGAGTMIMTSALNDYRGATIIHQGALLVNGTIANSFLANVRNGGTLGGNGTTGAVKVESGGTLAPGNLLGNTSKLTTGSMLLSNVGAKLSIELGGTTIGGNGVNGYDQIAAIGEVVLNGATLEGTLLGGFIPTIGALFFIVDNDGTDPVQGIFAEGSQLSIGGELFNISYTGDLSTNSFTGGNDIVLQYVPEPTSAALIACAGVALGLTRRRRARA